MRKDSDEPARTHPNLVGLANELVTKLTSSAIDAINFVWPAHSLLSQNFVPTPGQIEPDLWQKLNFITDPCCTLCGFPFEYDQGPNALCLSCEAEKPAFDQARAALVYDDLSRKLVLDLKYAARRDGLATFGHWLALAAPFAKDADFIIPTPLHFTRLLTRGHNQAAWLAQALAKSVHRPWHPDILWRTRRTPSQGGLTASGRARNVQGAFRVNPAKAAQIVEKSIVLVDDVYTTGATLEACARTLRRAGATRVDAVCLTRVVRPAQSPI